MQNTYEKTLLNKKKARTKTLLKTNTSENTSENKFRKTLMTNTF